MDISPFTRDNYIHGHHSSTTSCLHFVCVCNKSDLIGTLASVIVLTGQTCGDCHLIIKLAIQSFLGFIQLNIPLFYMVLRARFLQLLQSRMSMPRDNTRARREGRQPRYLDDFLLELPRRHLPHTIPDQAVGGAISPSHVDALAPPAGQKQSSPLPEAFLSALREMREDNQQLRLDMQQIVQALSPRASEAPPAPKIKYIFAAFPYIPYIHSMFFCHSSTFLF